MFTKILVPLDSTKGSLRALKPAAAFARATGAELVAATVLFADVIDEDIRRRELLEQAASVGVEVDRAVVGVSTISVASGLNHLMDKDTLVVIASPGHPHTARPFGNVSEEIVHHRLDGLSIIVGPHVDVENFALDGPVIGCVDPAETSNDLIDAVGQTSRELGLDPWLISVAENTDIPVVAGGIPGSGRALETNQLRSLARHMEAGGSRTVNYEILHSPHTAKEIVRFVESMHGSLLAVATRDRDGISRLLFGSVAMSLVKRATVPVLAVHHEGVGR